MFLSKMGTGGHASGDVAEAIDFDGTNDYLSRSSDLVGNVDSKTFTFSAWVWSNNTNSANRVYAATLSGSARFSVAYNAGMLIVSGVDSTGTTFLSAVSTSVVLPINTFSHVLVSIDLANTANRSIYINDVSIAVTWNTYTNGLIDFTLGEHSIGEAIGFNQKVFGRISHLFLDYTYRDLSIEANRRLFITADRKPAKNQATLNPIMYLPMSDPTQPGLNLGTGGDFALTGVVARSGRGPNQFNAPYSDLDGSADYLSRTTNLTGVANSKAFTIAFNANVDSLSSTYPYIFSSVKSGFGYLLEVFYFAATSIWLRAVNSAGTGILGAQVTLPTTAIGRNMSVQISIDLSDTGKRFVYINGQAASVTYSTYINDTVPFSSADPDYFIGKELDVGAYWYDGKLGNVFFDTRYIDLSDPANLAKFCTGTGIDCKPVDMGANGELPFGTPPLMYLPMYANNAGKNYGTGGDFTVNSGPFVGSRGPNEFWGNKADFYGSPGYLARTSALSGVSDGKVMSFAAYIGSGTPGKTIFSINPGGNNSVQIERDSSSGSIAISARNAVGTLILSAVGSIVWSFGWLFISFDLTTTTKRTMYRNDSTLSTLWTTYVNDSMNFSAANSAIATAFNGTTANALFPDYMAEFYFTTDYIDFSQEANRLKFRDAFGNPTNLPALIEAGEVPNPAIYMRFDPSNWGKNSGTGGDFTAYGTITDGGQL